MLFTFDDDDNNLFVRVILEVCYYRWHTWRRGWPSAAATHLYLRDWRLKTELEGRIQIYSKAVNPTVRI